MVSNIYGTHVGHLKMSHVWQILEFTPPEIEHDTQKKEIEDVSPIKNGDFPLSHWFSWRVYS